MLGSTIVLPSFAHEFTSDLPLTDESTFDGHEHDGLQQSQYRVVFVANATEIKLITTNTFIVTVFTNQLFGCNFPPIYMKCGKEESYTFV